MTKTELDARFEQMTATVDRVSRQIGQLGNKFGLFAQGMSLPSLERITGVHIDKAAARRAIKEGLYVAHAADDVMQLQVPAGFRPRSFRQ